MSISNKTYRNAAHWEPTLICFDSLPVLIAQLCNSHRKVVKNPATDRRSGNASSTFLAQKSTTTVTGQLKVAQVLPEEAGGPISSHEHPVFVFDLSLESLGLIVLQGFDSA